MKSRAVDEGTDVRVNAGCIQRWVGQGVRLLPARSRRENVCHVRWRPSRIAKPYRGHPKWRQLLGLLVDDLDVHHHRWEWQWRGWWRGSCI